MQPAMSSFTDILLVSPLADGKTWVTQRPFGYNVGAEGSTDRVDVPIGFRTDFATVPRLLWVILPKWGRYGNATVIHDYLYWVQERPRPEADRILLEAMGVLAVHPVVKYTMYWGVRLFGWLAWYCNKRDRAEGLNRVGPVIALKSVEVGPKRKGALAHLVAQTFGRTR
jgi:hypothetical protein